MGASSIKVGSGYVWVAAYADARDYTSQTDVETLLSSTFQNLGFTSGGAKFSYALDVKDISVDQKSAPVRKLVTGFSGKFASNLVEFSMRSLQVAIGGGVVATDADGTKTFTPPAAGGELALIWTDKEDPAAVTEYLAIPKCFATGGIEISANKEDETKVPFEVEILEADNHKPFIYGLTASHPSAGTDMIAGL